MALNKYRSKRNFKATPEPEGDEAASEQRRVRDSGQTELCFVVQLHDASRMHFDLRLELEGTMKSWAIPKGPSLNPLDRRLAVEVEDHPLEYNNFEGVIPPGNYGAGVVMIWDEGTYTARSVTFPAKNAADALRRGYAKGHMTFLLEGQKLKGEFALVRLAKGDGRNWLLLKKHDRFASSADITHADRSARSGRTLGEIASQAHAEGKVWLSAKKAAEAPKKKPEKKKTISKTKVAAKELRKALSPRRKKNLPAQTEREARTVTLESWSPGAGRVSDKSELQQEVFDGYRAHAFLDAEGKLDLRSKSRLPLSQRFPSLCQALGTLRGPLAFDCLIVPLDGSSQPRLRGKSQGQSELSYALYIYDLLHADGCDLRSLPLQQRLELLTLLELEHPACRIVPPSSGSTGETLLLREKEAPYGQKGRLSRAQRQSPEPSRGRDKPQREVPGSVHSVVSRKVQSGAPARVALTNRSKIYWPDEGISKGQLLDYYEAIAPMILPHLKDRPQSLHRQPNGIHVPGFFQKEVSGQVPGWMETASIVSGRSGQSVNYALCQSKEALLYLVNLGCIEINTWLSRVQAINHPDYVVFDLDPGEIGFDEVIKVALSVRELVESLGGQTFCKTSGSRGLHVYVPIIGGANFDAARLFAEGLSKAIHARLPATTSLDRSPARRTRLIYLDFLQNRVGQTMASIYSVRPRPGATVSTPLKWAEVKPGLDPSRFNMSSILGRLDKYGDLWEKIQKAAVPLAALQAAFDELSLPEKARSPRPKRRRQ